MEIQASQLEIPLTTVKDSTRIAKYGYDEKAEVCRIEFVKGGTYDYHKFPKQLWLAFQKAESVGTFFQKYIVANKALTTKKIKA